jgi:hypothetical protein
MLVFYEVLIQSIADYLLSKGMADSDDSWQEFRLMALGCIKTVVLLLEPHELVRPTDQPYDMRYFASLEGWITELAQHCRTANRKTNDQNHGETQELQNGFHFGGQGPTPDRVDIRTDNVTVEPEHRLGEGHGQRARATQTVADVNKINSNTDDHFWSVSCGTVNHKPTQDTTRSPLASIQAEASQSPSYRFNSQDPGYRPSEQNGSEHRRAFGVGMPKQSGSSSQIQATRIGPLSPPSGSPLLVCPKCHEHVNSLSKLMYSPGKSFVNGNGS